MSFDTWFKSIDNRFQFRSDIVHTEKWQGIDISAKPEMATHELRHVFMKIPMSGDVLDVYREDIKPNLPWADDHFEERVCGFPINPGIQWSKWPYAHSAKTFLDEEGKFNHNYMERYWPRFAGMLGATSTAEDHRKRLVGMYGDVAMSEQQNHGIEHPLGDLSDVVKQLLREPHTRQAVLPIFFPEDTGAVHGGRVPCSLTYQFIMRNNKLDVVYSIRSCDYLRHFRDDVYLTVRLLLWVLEQLRKQDAAWCDVFPGEYVMLITSLHLFRNDYVKMFGAIK